MWLSKSLLCFQVSQKTGQLSLLIEYLPSIVITIANFITPIIFEIIVQYEDYAPAFVIRFTLIRYVTSFCIISFLGLGTVKQFSIADQCSTSVMCLMPMPHRYFQNCDR